MLQIETVPRVKPQKLALSHYRLLYRVYTCLCTVPEVLAAHNNKIASSVFPTYPGRMRVDRGSSFELIGSLARYGTLPHLQLSH